MKNEFVKNLKETSQEQTNRMDQLVKASQERTNNKLE